MSILKSHQMSPNVSPSSSLPTHPLVPPINQSFYKKNCDLYNELKCDNLSPILQLFQVCAPCQQHLFGTFDHCLAEATNIHSDELKYRKEIKNNIFSNLKKSKIHVINENIDIASTLISESTAAKSKQNRSKFSGEIYRRVLEDQAKNFLKLSGKIYDQTLQEQAEAKNIELLQHALNKSAGYYLAAEKWQERESRNLNQDLKYLKAEMTAVLAFVVHSEKEKSQLRDEISEIDIQIKDKENDISIKKIQIEKNQEKAKECEAEFEFMRKNIEKLKFEALYGSDDVLDKNDQLQKNLDKLSRDFELSSKELSASIIKIKELDFERDELQYQYKTNMSLKKLIEKNNTALTVKLDNLGKEADKCKKEFNEVDTTLSILIGELSEFKQVSE
ncbi:hypothetical protein HK096_011231, partial [Nowakowskiella sp. JEL0078]